MPGRRGEGRTAVVTGAGSGIGSATARRLAAEGVHVVLVGRTAGPLECVRAEIERLGGRATCCPADVCDSDGVHAVVEEAVRLRQRLDILVHAAGILDEPDFLEIDAETFRRTIEVNVTGAFLMSQAAARAMVARGGGGSIVHVSSIDAMGADGPTTAYPASKAAVASLVRTSAVQLASHGIRVNGVAPGYVDTPMTAAFVSIEERERMRSAFDRVPMRRLIAPDEVASAIAFLASDDASAITGINLVVDGGLTANLYVPETVLPAEGSSP